MNGNTSATDPKIREHVQRRLLELGYVDGGPVDGDFGDQSRDQLLIFRRREKLPLVDYIDDEVLRALDAAKPKERPAAQAMATAEKIAPKVEAVAANKASISTAWHTRLWAFITAIPASVVAIILAVVDQFDEAIAAISPLMSTFAAVPTYVWVGGFAVVAMAFAYQSNRMKAQSQKAEDKMVEGFRQGTVKGDVKEVAP